MSHHYDGNHCCDSYDDKHQRTNVDHYTYSAHLANEYDLNDHNDDKGRSLWRSLYVEWAPG